MQTVKSETLDIRMFCGTWNVAGIMLDDGSKISEWLNVELGEEDGPQERPPDLFAVGFQEVVELNPQTVVMDSLLDIESKANSLAWFTLVYTYLNQYGQRHGVRYSMVAEQRLLGTYLIVLATDELSPKISGIQGGVVPTGIAGRLGNKGAVAVRVHVARSTTVCIVCAHMAAFRENVEARNEEYRTIMARPLFPDTMGKRHTFDPHGHDHRPDAQQERVKGNAAGWGGLFIGSGLSPSRNAEVKNTLEKAKAKAKGAALDSNRSKGSKDDKQWVNKEDGVSFAWPDSQAPKIRTVAEADVVVWMGDLNYRIIEGVPDEEVFRMIEEDQLEAL
ncbi:unnamed protein product, partial [Discosporangium mesarthrocarpum]